jgi:transposase-like protein
MNNIIEPHHRAVNSRAEVMLRFKTFSDAARTIARIELVHRVRKGQSMLNRKLQIVFGSRAHPGSRV